MATFEYQEGDYGYIHLIAERGEEIPIEVAQTFALLQIGGALDNIGRAVYELAEQMRDFGPIKVELEQ